MRLTALIWIGSLLLLLSTVPLARVQRTQEARVLVCAREMIDGPRDWQSWLIPHANGIIRLQKPPLAYWLAACSFAVFDVHGWAGRLPMAMCGWLIVIIAHAIARRQFGRRAAFFAATLLVGSFLFYRYARLAETDVLVTLFLSGGVVAIWRGFDEQSPRRSMPWFALSGVCIGMVGIAKGLPAFFAIVFLIGLTVVTHDWRSALRWIISGAPILALLIGGGWWAIVTRLPEARAVLSREMNVLIDEPDHPGLFVIYLPMLLKAMLPWSVFGVIGLAAASARWRVEPKLRVLIIWCLSIFLPLCFVANKQEHYLLPMMPPLAMLAGWWIDRASTPDAPRAARQALRVILKLMIVACAIAAIVLLPLIRRYRGEIVTMDMLAAATLVCGTIVLWQVFRRRELSAFASYFVVIDALIVAMLLGPWWPTTQTFTPRDVAQRVRLTGGRSYCFYGENISLPLIFELRAIVPQIRDEAALLEYSRGHRGLIVIAQTKSNVAPPPVPLGFLPLDTIKTREQRFEIYREKP